MKSMTETFQLQAHRPVGLVVLISPDHENLGAEVLDRLEGCLLADVAKVPNLVRFPDRTEQGWSQPVVGIREDGDAQRAGHLADGNAGKNRPDLARMTPGRPFDPGHEKGREKKVGDGGGAQKSPGWR